MRKTDSVLKRPVRCLLLACILTIPLIAANSAASAQDSGSHGKTPHQHSTHHHNNTGNPLLEEMMTLNTVIRDVVSAMVLGDGKGVHKALEAMHGTMEKTHEGLHAGAVKIPKNADGKEDFVKMDKEFHADLELLARAAHANNQEDMLKQTKKLLEGCVRCHQAFRK